MVGSSKSKHVWTTKQGIIFAVISLLLGILIFILAYTGTDQRTLIGSFNQPILSFLIDHRELYITNLMQFITNSVDVTVIILALAIIIGIWIFVKHEIWRPFMLIFSMGLAYIVSTSLKSFFMIDRPPQINMILPLETDFSFPSIHTIGIAVLLLTFGYLIYSRRSSIRLNLIWVVVTTISVSAVAISRMYLGYHWLTDVVASVGLALIILAITIFIDQLFIRKSRN